MNRNVPMNQVLGQQDRVNALAALLSDIVLGTKPNARDEIGNSVAFASVPGEVFSFEATVHLRTVRFRLRHVLESDNPPHNLMGQYELFFVDGNGDFVSAGWSLQLIGENRVVSLDGRVLQIFEGDEEQHNQLVYSAVAKAAVAAVHSALPVVAVNGQQVPGKAN